MKRVVELLEITEVPDDHIECSNCGLFRPPKDYKNEDQKHQSRTNCKVCYNMSWELMQEAGEAVKRIKCTPKRRKLERKLEKQQLYKGGSISRDALIEKFKALPENAFLVITETGYYSDCSLANLHDSPDKIEDADLEDTDAVYYSLGYSSQEV